LIDLNPAKISFGEAAMKALLMCLVFLSSICFGQIAPVSKLLYAGGFLEVCGAGDTQPSTEQIATMKSAPPSKAMDALTKALDDHLAEETMCVGYVAGLTEGWKEGHEHGVAAAQFPDGWPKDEDKALKALPLKQLAAADAAMKVDVPCIPDYVTIGQERVILIKYIREQQKTNPFVGMALTRHIIWLAFQQAFPCTLQPK
jgi:hypothetical protein